ncbi:MAG: OOP family OmpA-OmpF porin [Crocinitomicaceae bacterium]|jgi:OOP family OmpA-OmpF porin
MKLISSILFTISVLIAHAAEFNPNGTWQGVMIRKGTAIEAGTLFYAEFDGDAEFTSGTTREELYDSPYYSVKSINGDIENNDFHIRQVVELKSKKSSRNKWCRMSADLIYDETTGYLKGTYVSSDCRRVIGEIILYRSDFVMSKGDEMEVSHIWFDQFVKDYKDGLSAPEIRKIERSNFVFQPIFFDYDKSEIRSEHEDFLDRMIKIIKGHSDLRVRVTGHTDSDGSLVYNDSLSMRRADAIIAYFVRQGLTADRLKIVFKGEREPIDSNTTSEGKQRNRRVDFAFI